MLISLGQILLLTRPPLRISRINILHLNAVPLQVSKYLSKEIVKPIDVLLDPIARIDGLVELRNKIMKPNIY